MQTERVLHPPENHGVFGRFVTRWRFFFTIKSRSTLYIGYTAIGYGAKSVKGWVLGCPDLPTVYFIGCNVKNRL